MIPVLDQALQRVKAVEDQLALARGKWSSTGNSLGEWFGVSPQSQVLGALKTFEGAKDKWASRRFRLAQTDQAGWDLWIREGNDLLKNLASTAQDAETSSLPAIIAQTAAVTAVEAGQVAKVIATEAVSFGRWLVVGAVAVSAAVLVWKLKAKK